MQIKNIDKALKKKEFTIGERVIFRAKETIIHTDYDYGVIWNMSDLSKIQVLTRAGVLYISSQDILGVVLDSLLEAPRLPIDVFLEVVNKGGIE